MPLMKKCAKSLGFSYECLSDMTIDELKAWSVN